MEIVVDEEQMVKIPVTKLHATGKRLEEDVIVLCLLSLDGRYIFRFVINFVSNKIACRHKLKIEEISYFDYTGKVIPEGIPAV